MGEATTGGIYLAFEAMDPVALVVKPFGLYMLAVPAATAA